MAGDGVKWCKAITDSKGNPIFGIHPNVDEREEFLRVQIVGLLVKLSNALENYDKAIKFVEGYLKSLIAYYPEDAEWIKETAQKAGQEFTVSVGIAKKQDIASRVSRGESIIKLKRVDGGQ